MIDLFVLLTPIFVFAIVALLGFVGCNQVFGLTETTLAPDLNDIVPSSGPSAGGTAVQILGDGLTGTQAVAFGGIAASFTVKSDNEIDAVSPPNPAVRRTSP